MPTVKRIHKRGLRDCNHGPTLLYNVFGIEIRPVCGLFVVPLKQFLNVRVNVSIRDVVRHVVNGVVLGELFKILDVAADCGNDASVEVLMVKLIKKR